MLVEVRSHSIPVRPRWRPLRPFRFTLRRLMLAVIIAGLYFALCAHLVQLNSASLYHAEQAYQSSLSRYPNRSYFSPGTELPPDWKGAVPVPPGAPPEETWHQEMSVSYTAAIRRLWPLVSGLFIGFVSIGTVTALGRGIHALFRHSFAPATEEPPQVPR